MYIYKNYTFTCILYIYIYIRICSIYIIVTMDAKNSHLANNNFVKLLHSNTHNSAILERKLNKFDE